MTIPSDSLESDMMDAASNRVALSVAKVSSIMRAAVADVRAEMNSAGPHPSIEDNGGEARVVSHPDVSGERRDAVHR